MEEEKSGLSEQSQTNEQHWTALFNLIQSQRSLQLIQFFKKHN